MVGPGGTPPGGCLIKAGEIATKAIVNSVLLATIQMWSGKFGKTLVMERIVKNFSETEVYDGMKMLSEVCSLPNPKPRKDSPGRTKAEALAKDIHELLYDLDKENKLPKIVVSSSEVQFCPVDIVNDSEPGILVRMQRLEKAVTDMLSKPAAVQSVQTVQQVAASGTAGWPAAPAEGFGAALDRARSLSRSREEGRRGQGGAGARDLSGGQGLTWAERTAKRSRPEGAGAGRPGDVNSEGFRVPGRPARKAVPKGCSTVDLSHLGRSVVAPVERYIGGTILGATEDDIKAVLKDCAAVLEGGDKLEILKVERLTGHASARTQSWKVTVPFICQQLLENPALYPPGWTHRAFFAPRGERSKRPIEGGRREAGRREAGLAQEQERIDRMVEERVTAGVAARMAESAAAASVGTAERPA